MSGIYIHIPFCKQACHYCDFHFSTNLENQDKMVNAICEEILIQKNYLKDSKIDTIYFGGGTPSLLNQAQINKILDQISKLFNIASEVEITLEANPDDLSKSTLKALKQSGINRLSIGIQTFDDQKLRYINRAHDSFQAKNCVPLAQDCGFDQISVDLIYGMSHSNHSVLESDLKIIESLQTTHVSAYCMTIEEKTVFGNWQSKGKLKPATDDFQAQQYELTLKTLSDFGFEQYELSNYAKNKQYSKHNTAYWFGKHYLGVGPSAHSFDGKTRQYNIKNNNLYINTINELKTCFEKEILSPKDQFNELLLTGFRTIWGIDLAVFNSYKPFFMNDTEIEIKKLLAENLIEIKNNRILITKSSRFVTDYIIDRLFII